MYDIIMMERLDFHKACLRKRRVCLARLISTVEIRLGVMFNKTDAALSPTLMPSPKPD